MDAALVTAVILAGGGSTRMGRPKEMLPVAPGVTLADRTASELSVLAREVVVAGGTEALPGLRHLADRCPGAGPLAGIDAALAGTVTPTLLICPCDLPFVTAALLQRLLEPTPCATVFRIVGEPRVRPLPLRLERAALADAVAALDGGKRSVHSLLDRLDVHEVMLDADEARLLDDVDTPEDYDASLARGS